MVEVTLFIAFIGGVVSFLSPCVLPIVPGFLAYLAGTSVDETGNPHARMPIFINSVFFVLGFAIVFAVLGVLLNTLLNAVAYEVQAWLARLGGAVVIFFGLYLIGVLKIPFLERDHKFRVTRSFGSRYLTSTVFGAAFAVGWTPCVGAALGAILGLAAAEPTTALYLLFSYSIGLGLPFIIVGAFTAQASSLINRYVHILKYVNIAFGVVLIVLGVLVFTQSLNLIANFGFLNSILLQ